MADAVVMPALEMAQETGVLVRWLKREGEPVAKGEPIMEVETDKTTVEIESPATGVLGGVVANEGDVIPVGRTIAWVLADGETPPAEEPAGTGSEGAGRARSFTRKNNGGSGRTDSSATARAGDAARLRPASPKARRIAGEIGVELAGITGSGPGGAVLTADVEASSGHGADRGGNATVETPGSLWLTMARRMSESWAGVPHFYLMRELDAGRLLEWRSRAGSEVLKSAGTKLTVSDLLVACVAQTLKQHPRLNASWKEGTIRLNGQINVGLAVAIDSGLVVPVIRNADSASLADIAANRAELVSRARDRRLAPAEMSNGTFTITNLGMYNVDAFNAIVNPPQAAILAVGRIADRVVPVDGRVEIRPVMIVTLSCDHRVVDGAQAARFLDDLAHTIEDRGGSFHE